MSLLDSGRSILSILQRLADKPDAKRSRPAQSRALSAGQVSLRITDIVNGSLSTDVYTDAASVEDALAKESPFRVISVYSKNSLHPLQVTPSLLAKIFQTYDVSHDFVDVVASFGEKPNLAESGNSNVTTQESIKTGECCILYHLNYVEENFRPNVAPWSFRHTGVYHRHDKKQDMFILLHPTPGDESAFEERILSLKENRDALVLLQRNPFVVHDMLFSTYLVNWRWYLRYEGHRFSRENDLAMVTEVAEANPEDSFERVKSLRNTNDFVLFSGGCCTGGLKILERMGDLRVVQSVEPHASLEPHISRMKGYIRSADVLHGRIRNAIDLVGYTLTIHNQLEAASIDKQMHKLTTDMRSLTTKMTESARQMQQLTEKSVNDSVTIKIITFVSAFYIPGSFAGTLFGMNFFVFDVSTRRIVIGKDFWIFIAVWLPLTLLTAALYFTILWKDRRNKRTRLQEQLVGMAMQNGSA